MSRTVRQYIGGQGRDGEQDWPTVIARDNRATGLRTHKRDQRVAKASPKSVDADSLPCGKHHRYTERYMPTSCRRPADAGSFKERTFETGLVMAAGKSSKSKKRPASAEQNTLGPRLGFSLSSPVTSGPD